MHNRRDFIKSTALAGLATLSTQGPFATAATSKKNPAPNIVYVFPDQMRRHAMGYLGQDPVVTPRLDQFAAQSVDLTDACSTMPICSPHRACLMTGQYPHIHGVVQNCHGSRPHIGLDQTTPRLTGVLHDNGYHVGYIGKWHINHGEKELGYQSPFIPESERHGIDFMHTWAQGSVHHYDVKYWTNDTPKESPIHIPNTWSAEHETDVAIDYIENKNKEQRDPSKPLALFVSWNPPHNPYNSVPTEYREPYEDASLSELLYRKNVDVSKKSGQAAIEMVQGYYACVTGVDYQFGRILDCLKRTGLEENTIVVFTSDHGEMMGSHGLMGKTVFYEESLGVPFLVRWPGQIRARQDNLLIGSPDIMPTLLGLAGLENKIPATVQGSNYANALLENPQAKRPEFAWYWNHYGHQRGLRSHEQCCYFVRESKKNAQGDFLFNLNEDPFQMRNLAKDDSKSVREFGGEIKRWLKSINDPYTTKGNNFFDTIPS